MERSLAEHPMAGERFAGDLEQLIIRRPHLSGLGGRAASGRLWWSWRIIFLWIWTLCGRFMSVLFDSPAVIYLFNLDGFWFIRRGLFAAFVLHRAGRFREERARWLFLHTLFDLAAFRPVTRLLRSLSESLSLINTSGWHFAFDFNQSNAIHAGTSRRVAGWKERLKFWLISWERTREKFIKKRGEVPERPEPLERLVWTQMSMNSINSILWSSYHGTSMMEAV